MIESRGRGVLDSPPSRGMTSNPESVRGDILDCFVARAPRNDEEERASATLRSRAPDAAQRPPAMRSIVRFNGALPSRRPSIRNRRVAWGADSAPQRPRVATCPGHERCASVRVGLPPTHFGNARLSSRADVLCLPKDLRLWIDILARYPRKQTRVFPVTIVLSVQHPHQI